MSVQWEWPNKRSEALHAFWRGPGTGDTSLCGVEFSADRPTHDALIGPACRICLARERDWEEES